MENLKENKLAVLIDCDTAKSKYIDNGFLQNALISGEPTIS